MAEAPELKLSCVVPATDAPPTLARCIAAIRAAEEGPQELIVVTEGTPTGPTAARSDGCRRASGDVLVFVDADVIVHADAFRLIRAAFEQRPELTAVFGSYDDALEAPGVVSGFRNLLHHHVHQQGGGLASTFWTGLGAVRRGAFEALGGFDVAGHPWALEDVELGERLTARAGLIWLDPQLQGTHLKHQTLVQMVRTDFLYRGLPWARILLRSGRLHRTLNLGWRHRLSAIASVAAAISVAARRPRAAALALLSMAALNARFYGLLWRRGGASQAAAGIGLHVLHHLTGAAAAGAAVIEAVLFGQPRPQSPSPPSTGAR